jgi:hypothetical protein
MVRFYTIVRPYPQLGNMELLADRKETAFWLADILGGTEHLFAIYNMPSVRTVSPLYMKPL